jgi:L-ascorbate metabolism protein UlaG (beta-lactamase superfamily)
MEIRYLGHASFHLKGKSASVVTDPFDKETVGLKFPTVSADIVTVSHHHADHDIVKEVEGTPLVLDLPGEFEKEGIRVTGFETYHDKEQGAKRGKNIVFKIEVDGVSILHCGDLGHVFNDETLEEIGTVDVLLVPVGGVYTIDSTDALQVIKQVDPKTVIPMHYKVEGMKDTFKDLTAVDDFLTKMGIVVEEKMKKLVVKPEEESEQMKTVVMEAA